MKRCDRIGEYQGLIKLIPGMIRTYTIGPNN